LNKLYNILINIRSEKIRYQKKVYPISIAKKKAIIARVCQKKSQKKVTAGNYKKI